MSPRVASMTDTGKVRIGIAHIKRNTYTPPRDALLLQQALLDKRTAQALPLFNRFFAHFWRWL